MHESIAEVPSMSLLGPVTGSNRAPGNDLRILSPSVLVDRVIIRSVAAVLI